MDEGPQLDDTLLRKLLDGELRRFQDHLENENPGLSPSEIDRYMRAAKLFCEQIAGNRPRTHGRKGKGTRG
ncbi:MAG: hypothetical protein VB852_09620 [Deltaproteobacteria bacterium]|jgi:hypothetical protein